MRGRRVAWLVLGTTLAAVAGCTLLTDIPDDASSGFPGAKNGAHDAGSDGGRTSETGTSDGSSTETVTDAAVDRSEPNPPGAVALDSVGPSGEGIGGTNKISPLVWSHATRGTNRALFVAVAVSADPDGTANVQSVEYDNTALKLVKTQHSNDQEQGYISLWVLTNPSDGAHSVSVAFSGNVQTIIGGSISFTGVDQQTPYQNLAALGGTGTHAKLSVSSAPGDMVIAAFAAGCDITSSGQAIGWFRNDNCTFGGGNGAQSAAPGATTVDLSYQLTDDWWGIVGADVKAAAP